MELIGARGGMVVLKRCVDVDELLATSSAGQADAAVVALDAPGLDPTAVDVLHRHQVRVVAVGADSEAARTPRRARRRRRPGRPRRPRTAARRARGRGGRAGPSTRRRSTRPSCRPRRATPAGSSSVWGPAGAPGRTTVATSLASALARRGLRTTLVDADPYGGAVAQHLGVLDEVSGLLSAARLTATGRSRRGSARCSARLGDRLTRRHRAAARPTAGSRSAPASSSTCSRSRAATAHVVVDTGFSLEDDPAGDLGARPGAQPADARRRSRSPTRCWSSAPPTRSACPGWPAALVELRERRAGRTGARRGQPDARRPRLVRARHRRHGRGLRPAGRRALPARRPRRRRPGADHRDQHPRGG